MKTKKKRLRETCPVWPEARFYGATTVGTKGQIVIPAEARKDMRLKAGDRVLVVGRLGKITCLFKADQLEGIIKTFVGYWSGTGVEKDVARHAKRAFGDLLKHK